MRDPYPRATSSVSSSDPSLTTTASTAGCACAKTLASASGRKCACRKHGTITDTSGAVTADAFLGWLAVSDSDCDTTGLRQPEFAWLNLGSEHLLSERAGHPNVTFADAARATRCPVARGSM